MEKTPARHNKWISYKIPPDWDGKKVEEVLRGPLALSNRMINRLTRCRGIRLNGRMPWLGRRVKKGDRLRVAVRPLERSDLVPEPVPFGLLYEDADLMVVDKPAGVNVHPVHPGETGTLTHGILYHWQSQGFEGRVRPVHRLDRDTTGVLLIAKNAYMHQLLDRQLKNRSIGRIYLAIVQGRLTRETGAIRLPIGRDPTHPLRRRVAEDGAEAITLYRVLASTEQASLIEARLETGRTHQIRVHFAHLGHPLWGDRLYGGPGKLIGRHALHAERLSFTHPLKEEKMTFSAPPPQDFARLMEALGLRGNRPPAPTA
ncbi:MAG: RluA family pseudouridine synthase [Bacillota bacterium]|jgi:23S rRNA pseudouridine1911/1915/1917 synthase|nr:RluA family pseudouridine synthase [Bacillota bacterium]